MIRISPRERDIIRHALSDSPDLSRDKLAEVAKCHPVYIGRILTDLSRRGAVTIKRGPHRTILSITPTFEFKKGVGYWTGHRPKKHFF